MARIIETGYTKDLKDKLDPINRYLETYDGEGIDVGEEYIHSVLYHNILYLHFNDSRYVLLESGIAKISKNKFWTGELADAEELLPLNVNKQYGM